jgi:molybdopterin-guanine dinucleotide biosynthesis protein A
LLPPASALHPLVDVPVRRAALILAGGASRRMGRPKAALELEGETLLHRVVRIALAACTEVVVVAAPGQALPPLPEVARRVDDPAELVGSGPLVGALAGLRALDDSDVVYIGAVDAAWLSTAHVDAMLGALEADPAALAVVPETIEDGRRIVHATSGAVRMPAARETAIALVRSGQRALSRLYDGLDARRIAVAALAHPESLRACNTPADYAAAREWIARHG